jgi:hypothetical protein
MKTHFLLRLALCCLALATATAIAQAKKAPKTTLPTEQHKRLDALAGVWEVAVKFKIGPDKFQTGTATCTAKWILDGKFLQQEYKSTLNGRPFSVLQMLGYDTPKQQFIEVYFNSLETAPMHNVGTLSDDGKAITHLGEHLDMATQKLVKLRTVYTFTDKDHFLLEWFQTGADGQEERVVTLTHTRRKR